MSDGPKPDDGPRVDIDALVAAGVYDPDAPDAAERLELLQWLMEQGVSLDQIVDADRRGSLYRAGLDALLWPDGGGLTVAEVAAAAGMPEATVRRARRLIGLADPGDEPALPARRDRDAAARSATRSRCSVRNPRSQFTRALGTSTAAIAEAAISMFAVSVAEPMRDAGASSVEYAERVREATLIFTTARSAIDIMMRLQFDEAVDRLTGQWGDGERTAPRPGRVHDRVRRPGRIDAPHGRERHRRVRRGRARLRRARPPKPRRGTARAS